MSDRTKVLHLVTSLDVGGAETMLSKAVAHSDRERLHHVVVSMTGRGALADAIEKSGVEVHDLGMRRGVPNPLALLRLIAVIRKERPDILQTWLYHADLLGTIAAKLTRVPRLMWNIRCSDMDMRHYSRLSRMLVGALARLSGVADVCLVNSEAGKSHHQAFGYRPRRWAVIPNGFDLSRFRPDPDAKKVIRAELGIEGNELLIALVARFDPMKDHENFLSAAAIVSKVNGRAQFVLVGAGTGPENKSLHARIGAMGLSKRVTGLGHRNDMERILPALDLAVLSSAFGEGFPNVIGEAMAAGVVCVSTDVGDARLVIGDTGRVVAPRDSQALGRAMGEVLNLSEEQRAGFGAKARQRILDCFDINLVVRSYDDMYSQTFSKLPDQH